AIKAPIVTVTLRGIETVSHRRVQTQLFAPESKADRWIPRLANEIEAHLGPGTVGTLQLVDRWSPAERSALAPLKAPRAAYTLRLAVPDSHTGALLSGAPEPTRWLAKPIACPADLDARDVCVVVRLEAGRWWVTGHSQRDYGTAWVDSVSAVAWVELDRARSAASIRGWVD
ncbi:MAG: hypothetical protein ACREJ3_04505, partial [Polyangiaceae bacterium]